VTNLPAPDAEELRDFIAYLQAQGATESEIEDAVRLRAVGELSLELSLRGTGPRLSCEEASDQLGISVEHAGKVWRALGFPDPVAAPILLGPKDVEVLRVIAHDAHEFLGSEAALPFARVLGSALVLVAESIVDGFRVAFEVPQRDAGTPYIDIVRDYSEMAAVLMPPFIEAMDAILRRHIVGAARSRWAIDEERAAVTRDVTVGFVDLVGYTAATRALSPRRLSETIVLFEERVSEGVSSAGGRVVKLIGDEAMFVVEPDAACELALDLADTFAASGTAQVRVGLAAGPAVTIGGDFYGDVVNLAARLVKAAVASGVVVSGEVRAAAAGAFRFTELEPLELKGFDEPVVAYSLSRG